MTQSISLSSLCRLLFVAALSFYAQMALAQRVQVQLHLGGNASEASLNDDALTTKTTSTHYDSIGNIQVGLAANVRLFKHVYLRAEGNYKAYRTFFDAEKTVNGSPYSALGNIFNECWTVSVLPEFRFTLARRGNFEMPAFACIGPVLSFEQGKNFVENYVFDDSGANDYLTELDRNPAVGWSIGTGINPRWGRFGGLVELRYTRSSGVVESPFIPEVSYEHLAFLLGLTVDLWK